MILYLDVYLMFVCLILNILLHEPIDRSRLYSQAMLLYLFSNNHETYMFDVISSRYEYRSIGQFFLPKTPTTETHYKRNYQRVNTSQYYYNPYGRV